MKPIQALILAALFLTGFSLAWLIRHQQGAPDQGQAVTQTRSIPPRPAPLPRQNTEQQSKALLRDVLERRSPKIAKEDYRRLIDEFIKLAGINGLENEHHPLFRRLVWDWHAADPDAALAWILALNRPNDTATMLTHIIEDLANRDFDAAIALAKRYGAAEGRHLDMPYRFQIKLAEMDAAELVDILACFTQINSWSSAPVKFGEGFDFQQALNGIAEIQATFDENERLAFVPSNLLAEWAKHDPDAAWEWVLPDDKKVPGNDLVSLVRGLAPTAELIELAVFVAESPTKSRHNDRHSLWSILTVKPDPDFISGFLDNAPGGRQQNFENMLLTGLGMGGSIHDTTREILLSQASSAERVAAFQSEVFRREGSHYDQQRYLPILRRLGHSEEEIKLMIPPKP